MPKIRRATACALLLGMLGSTHAWAATLEGYWPMDEGSGTILADHSGQGRDGGASALHWVTGREGFGLDIGELDSAPTVSSTLSTTDGVSVCAWVKPRHTEDLHTIYMLGTQDPSSGYHWLYASGNWLHWQYATGTSTPKPRVDVAWKTNVWHHVAVTHDYAARAISYYVNGQWVDTYVHTNPVLSVSNAASSIGRGVNFGTHRYEGVIDELRVFDGVLTSSEVEELALIPPAIAVWPFDEGSGTVVNDSSGHGHHGTVTGAQWIARDDGSALSFDGQDDEVVIGDPLSTARGVTFGAWVRPAVSGGTSTVFTLGSPLSNGFHRLELVPGEMRWWFTAQETSQVRQVSFTPEPNRWYHLAVTHNYLAGNIAFYLDGTPYHTIVAETPVAAVSNGTARVASGGPPSPMFFEGDLDDVRLYDGVMSSNEVLPMVAGSFNGPYYVATNGSDAYLGTESHPFRTIAKGLTMLGPGKTLRIKEGTYPEDLFENIPSGTDWSAPVTVEAVPGHHVVLKPDETAVRVLQLDSSQHHIVIDGLVLDGANLQHDTVRGGGHHILFQNCEVRHARKNGIAGGWSHCTLRNLVVHDNGLIQGAHGLYISGESLLVEDCHIYNNFGRGLRNSGSYDSVFRNNRFHHNDVGNTVTAFELAGTNNLVYNNLIYANQSGVVLYGSGSFYNNTVFNNRNNGITIASSLNWHLANNLVYSNGQYGIRNARAGPDTAVEYNLAYGNGEANFHNGAGTVNWHDNLEVDPQLHDPASNDVHLSAGSPAIDAGIDRSAYFTDDFDGVPRPGGTAYDIGAYEYTTDGAPPFNHPPLVYAGRDRWTTLSANQLRLDGAAVDPEGAPLTYLWTQVSGPAPVTLVDAADPQTEATFPVRGAYELRLFADDGQLSSGDLVVVLVHEDSVAGQAIRLEAEDMFQYWHRIDEGTFASGGRFVSMTQENNLDLAVTLFPGWSGTYEVRVGYFDENDGQAWRVLALYRGLDGATQVHGNTQVDRYFTTNWYYDDPASPSNVPGAGTLVERSFGQVDVWLGDAVWFPGDNASTVDGDEWAALDYIEFVPLSQTEDWDADSIPDWWELAHFGSVTGAVATADVDGDGANNLEEYRADTLPTVPASVFRITAVEAAGSDSIRVEWIGGQQASQYLQRTEELGPGATWETLSTYSPPTPITNQFTDTGVGSRGREVYYRLEATR